MGFECQSSGDIQMVAYPENHRNTSSSNSTKIENYSLKATTGRSIHVGESSITSKRVGKRKERERERERKRERERERERERVNYCKLCQYGIVYSRVSLVLVYTGSLFKVTAAITKVFTKRSNYTRRVAVSVHLSISV